MAVRGTKKQKNIVVVALGGNALLQKGEKATIQNQIRNATSAAKQILPLAQQYHIILTHGNGPQVGNILIRTEESLGKAYALPLDVCVAESEGEIGYLLEQAFFNVMKKGSFISVASLLTQVLVDKKDPAFKHPTKPIGPFYKKSHLSLFRRKKIPYMFDAGRGYRRVVPSPLPLEILELKVINKLIKDDVIVIATGGGGIPVVREKGKLKGVEAVIDKDFASACLAKSVKAEELFILTGVDAVYLNYGKKKQKRISNMTIKEALAFYEDGCFPEGSMGPKILSAIDFLRSGGKRVVITSPASLSKALSGKKGTIIVRS
jgi:carbamate kinase